MPKSWQDEVQEILNRAEASAPQSKRQVPKTPRPPRSRGNHVELLGQWIMARFATTGDMLVTAAVLVVAALFMSIVLRQFASIIAIAGAINVRGGTYARDHGTARGPFAGWSQQPGHVAGSGHRAPQPASVASATIAGRPSPTPLAISGLSARASQLSASRMTRPATPSVSPRT